jgi:hypothetical protein
VRRSAIVLLAVLAVAGTASVAYATLSAKALRASILATARAQSSVHYVSHDHYRHARFPFTGDVGASEGRQVAKLHSKETGTVTVLVVDDPAYVQGDVNGLEIMAGLTAAEATQYAGQWISIPKGDGTTHPQSAT